jgi:hypothetical protein
MTPLKAACGRCCCRYMRALSHVRPPSSCLNPEYPTGVMRVCLKTPLQAFYLFPEAVWIQSDWFVAFIMPVFAARAVLWLHGRMAAMVISSDALGSVPSRSWAADVWRTCFVMSVTV